MNIIKYILIAVGLFAVIFFAYLLIGLISSVLWYLFVIGVIAAVGVGGYKFLKTGESPKLEGKQPISIKELDNADRTLEEYKQKYLPK